MSEHTQVTNGSVQNLLNHGELREAIQICESQIFFPVLEPNEVHWLYGLALLLNGQEEDAQSTWMMAMMEGSEEQVADWLVELIDTLDRNATFQEQRDNLGWTSLIRHHIRDIAPDNYGNVLKIIKIELVQELFTIDSFLEFRILDILNSEILAPVFSEWKELLLEILELYLNVALAHEVTTKFTAAIRPHLSSEDFIRVVFNNAVPIGHLRHLPKLAVELLDLCLELNSEDTEVLIHLSEMLMLSHNHHRAIEIGQKILCCASDPITKVLGSYYLLKARLYAGDDRIATLDAAREHEFNLNALIEDESVWSYAEARHLISSVHLLTYVSDHPQKYRVIQNQIVHRCENSIRLHWKKHCHRYADVTAKKKSIADQKAGKPLRIGYICSCLYNHSVGWLARTLIHHHDTKKFNIYIYAINTPESVHPVKAFYQHATSNYRNCGIESGVIADLIYEDQIDILIDLDSITRDTVCTVMALKPARIQATWMGWDAVGMSSIDYYIADNYSLPENAQDYYTEKIWRLPKTFLAIDGFEVGIPTVSRRDLDIPEDAIVFLNPQRGFKLTPEVLKLQLQILSATPNSYLLLKGIAEESLQQSLGQLAKEVGVSLDRLRPIPYAPSEEIHRANLAIADVIFDTFPYNGATTTMEALWMERPIVTLVGQQFSARNSYTMMMNAGITEGISWTPEEYVAWGIRLGTEPELRQQVAWKLRQGKKSAPLWNGKAFAQQMEAAYTEMYQIYVDRATAQPN
jgi:predicted O-linked N-acetylglucosamine transferase (SPINDLY family)